jgi:hypothetical protein
MSGNCSESS